MAKPKQILTIMQRKINIYFRLLVKPLLFVGQKLQTQEEKCNNIWYSIIAITTLEKLDIAKPCQKRFKVYSFVDRKVRNL